MSNKFSPSKETILADLSYFKNKFELLSWNDKNKIDRIKFYVELYKKNRFIKTNDIKPEYNDMIDEIITYLIVFNIIKKSYFNFGDDLFLDCKYFSYINEILFVKFDIIIKKILGKYLNIPSIIENIPNIPNITNTFIFGSAFNQPIEFNTSENYTERKPNEYDITQEHLDLFHEMIEPYNLYFNLDKCIGKLCDIYKRLYADRHYRVIDILCVMNQITDNSYPNTNLNKVIGNSDLQRFLMDFID